MANAFARALRKRMTPWETRLWAHLRTLRARGIHVRRQVPLGPYIVDFACLARRVVIEVDGEDHTQIAEDDRAREEALNAMGFRVLRFWNGDVTRDFDGVLSTIIAALES